MLGDELKKSLEPIQTSDELLAKTRAAIEKARLEQAAASIKETSTAASSKKRSFRYSYFLMAAVPVLCVALIVGGLVFLLPRMSKSSNDVTKSKRAKNSRSTSVAAAAENVDRVEKSYAEEGAYAETSSSEEWTMPDAVEDTTEAEDLDKNGETEVKDEPSETTAADDKHFVRPTPDIPFSDAQTVVAGEYLVCISEDGRSLFLCDKKTGAVIPESEEHVIPAIEDLDENETITGLFYSDETESLYIIVSDSTKDTADRKIYVCSFSDGSADGSAPSQVSEN